MTMATIKNLKYKESNKEFELVIKKYHFILELVDWVVISFVVFLFFFFKHDINIDCVWQNCIEFIFCIESKH